MSSCGCILFLYCGGKADVFWRIILVDLDDLLLESVSNLAANDAMYCVLGRWVDMEVLLVSLTIY